jgi:hypothetical protein
VYLKEILQAIQTDPSLKDVLLMPAVHIFGKKRKLTLQRVLQHLSTMLPEDISVQDYKNIYSWNQFKEFF